MRVLFTKDTYVNVEYKRYNCNKFEVEDPTSRKMLTSFAEVI